MSKEERQTKKELNNLVYPNHLKYLKRLKTDLKKPGTKLRKRDRKK